MSTRCDVAVIGAGIVGLSTARAISIADPSLAVVVLEKEREIASHQTGRNSGVIHAGLYYEPGSLKARLCVEGGARLLDYCAEHDIPVTQTGKVIVATDRARIPALDELERRAGANGVRVVRIGPDEIAKREPHARGIDGLWVPFTGSVDYARVAQSFVSGLLARRTEVHTDAGMHAARKDSDGRVVVETTRGAFKARVVVNCAGLHADRVAKLLGAPVDVRILAFRGEYWRLTREAAERVRGHIYPVPDPRFPHLGVHFTRGVDGRVEAGPNAVWAWGREAYGRISGNLRDVAETLAYDGFWALARRHWRTAVGEQWRSLNRRAFVENARVLLPELTVADLDAWRCGIRAQAVGRDGNLIHDFVIEEAPGIVNVINAPSPAATSCLTIGEHIARRALARLSA